ncbi:hypothetical protein Tco_0237490 [Tanacetum coccineum]
MPKMQVTNLKLWKPVKGKSAKKLMLEWIGEPNVGVVDHGQASQVTKEIGENSQQALQTMTQPSVFAYSFYAASDPFLADNNFDPFLDLDSPDDADIEIPQSFRKGKGGLETVEEDEIARGGGNETEKNIVTDVEEGSDSEAGNDSGQGSDSESSNGYDSDELVDKENLVEHVHVDMDTVDKSNADTLGVEDRHGEFNANEEIDVDLDVIDNEEFESASNED